MKGDLPFQMRSAKTLSVSNTGMKTIPRMNSGECGSDGSVLSCISYIPSTAMVKPSTSEPVSPMNILAGLKLK